MHLAVRMGMTMADAAALAEVYHRLPADVQAAVSDQLWLKAVLVEQRRRTRIAERPAFDARADRILELLDPPEKPA